MTMSILCCITVNGLFGRVCTQWNWPLGACECFFFLLSPKDESRIPFWFPVFLSYKRKKKKEKKKTFWWMRHICIVFIHVKLLKEKDARGSFSWWWEREKKMLLRTKLMILEFRFILFCFSFCERVSESSKELRRYFLDTDTKQHFFFALGILTISRINALNSRRNDQHILLLLLQLAHKKEKSNFLFFFCFFFLCLPIWL